MFNHFRKPGVTDFDATMLNWKECLTRMKRTAKYAPVYFVFVLAIVVISVGLLFLLSSESSYKNTLKNTPSAATATTYSAEDGEFGAQANSAIQKSAPDDDAYREEASPDRTNSMPKVRFDLTIFALCLLEAILITLLGIIFSGVFAGVFIDPINPIKLAPFVVIHSGALSFRFWICCSNDKLLHDVKINIGYAYDDRRKRNEILLKSRTNSGSNFTCIQQEEYSKLRGVWQIDIPLCSKTGIQLLDALEKHSDSNPVIKISISANTDVGDTLSREAEYDRLRLVKDAAFAPFHFQEDLFDGAADKTPRKLQDLEAFSNFCKITPIEATGDLDSSICPGNGIGTQATREDVLNQEKKWEYQINKAREQVKNLDDGQKKLQSSEELKARLTIEPITSWNPYMSYSDWRLINKLGDFI